MTGLQLAIACGDRVTGAAELIPGGLRWVAEFSTQASGISRRGKRDTPQIKAADYAGRLPRASARLLGGRNVLPWETPDQAVEAVHTWMAQQA